MSGSISFNPMITTNAAGSFSVQSEGFIAGTAYPDPANQFELAGGVLATTETLPIWGGVGIYEAIPTPGNNYAGQGSLTPVSQLGSVVGRATTISASGAAGALAGFSVFNQAHSFVNSPQSPVPQVGVGGMVNFYRFGSAMRLAVTIDPVLQSLFGSQTSAQVSWDFVNQRLIPYNAAWAANAITNATWSGGVATLTTTTAHGVAVGEDITITGLVATGGTLSYNGSFTTVAGTTGSTIKFALAATGGTYSSGGTLVAGGGAAPVKILDINIGNSMVPVRDPVTGFVTWNRSGSAAIVVI